MFENMNKDPMELIKELGLEKLDESSLDIVKKMLGSSWLHIWKFKSKISFCTEGETEVATMSIYNQNYIIMKQLLNLQEQNQQLIEQNHKVIELLTEIKDK